MSDKIVLSVAAGVSPLLAALLSDTVALVIPWLLVMLAAIAADLVAGIRKSLLLHVPVSLSTAFRETVGKVLVYTSFVMTACLMDVAMKGDANVAKWLCLIVAGVEVGSVISNILKPYGISLSLQSIIRMLARRSPLGLSDEETAEIVKEDKIDRIREREDKKWNRRRK